MEIPKSGQTENFRRKIWIAGAIILLLMGLAALFVTLFNLLLLVFAAVLISIYFYAVADLLSKYLKLKPPFAIIFSVFLNVFIIGLFFYFVGQRLNSQLDQLSGTFPQILANGKAWLSHQPFGDKILNFLNSSVDNGKASATIKAFFSSTFGVLSDFYIVLLLSLFFLANPKIYKKGVFLLLPENLKSPAQELWGKIHNTLKNWIKGQIIGFFFIAVLSALGLWILGMPLILALALIAGLLNFIPNFGPIIALIPAVLVGLMQGTETALLVAALYTLIQMVQTAVTQPIIQQKMVNVPPALLIFAQVGMGILTGFWGVLLATPLLAIAIVCVDKLYLDKKTS